MRYQSQFNDQALVFEKGVSAIDIITLNGVAKAADPYVRHKEIVLPSVAENLQTTFFDELMRIDVDMNPEIRTVKATIDTKKMVWRETIKAKKSTLTDYAGVARLAVSFSDLALANVNNVQVAIAPLTLDDGRSALMWFAEIPLENLQNSDYYNLFNTVSNLTTGFKSITPERYDQVIVPAQQIDYERSMTEIVALNRDELDEVKQKFKIGLDDTGARVQAATVMTLSRSIPQPNPEPKIAIFGSKNPVVFWLTEPEHTTPFAVVATTSDAWLDPSQAVSFDF